MKNTKNNQEVIDLCIDVLEENRIPKKEIRFALLKKLYKIKDRVEVNEIKIVDIHIHCNEVDRLHKINTSQAVINMYIKGIK